MVLLSLFGIPGSLVRQFAHSSWGTMANKQCFSTQENSPPGNYWIGILCRSVKEVRTMARKYSKSASKDVKRALHKKKRGTLKSGRSGKKVTSRKQAIAIGLSEARKKGKKVPKKKAS
jgi:uncharacterized protein DUF6496